MPEERTYSIAVKLLEKSRNGEIAWQDTYTEGRFAMHLADLSMTIERSRRGLAPVYFIFSIANEKGTVLDTIAVRDGQDGYEQLSELHELARRKALAVDAKLDSALKSLEREGALGQDEPPTNPDLPF